MAKNKIKYYPVGNGDCSLIKLSDKKSLLIDCHIREGKTDSDNNNIYDVKADIIENIEKRDKNPFIDFFILSHPDEDHCLGFKKNFYQGDPTEYDKSSRENEEILIDELWVTSLIFSNGLCEDAKAIKKEANRRIKLIEEDSDNKDKFGNKIRMVGYDGNERYDNIPSAIPGETIKISSYLELFIHAPFKADLISSRADKDRNSSSIVFQARFKENVTDTTPSTNSLFGGDADHYRWEKILEKSKKNNNKDKLKWDLFLAPHHCSWTFFNDVPYDKKENQEPKDYSLELLDYAEKGARIIASSKKIKKGKPNPPHSEAKDEYIKKLESKDKFHNTNTNKSEKSPQPIIFETSKNGAILKTTAVGGALSSAGGSSQQVNTPTTQG